MKKIYYLFILIFSLVNSNTFAQNNFMILKLSYGNVEIELYPDKAPNHVKRFKELADSGKYDGVVAFITSPKLWGGMLVAIPTAIPPAPLTNMLGY